VFVVCWLGDASISSIAKQTTFPFRLSSLFDFIPIIKEEKECCGLLGLVLSSFAEHWPLCRPIIHKERQTQPATLAQSPLGLSRVHSFHQQQAAPFLHSMNKFISSGIGLLLISFTLSQTALQSHLFI